ncbi:MAG: hypothetical protein ABEJ02_03660 [Candidatus Paceibacteria bacterium]
MDKKDTQLVKIFDKNGDLRGYKPRAEINKTKDIVSTIHVFVIKDDKLILSKIPANGHVFTGKIGSTFATMERKGDEDEIVSVQRAIKDDLDLEQLPDGISTPRIICDKFFYEGGKLTRFFKGYYIETTKPLVSAGSSCNIELVCFQVEQITDKIENKPDLFAPSLLSVWEHMNTDFITQP